MLTQDLTSIPVIDDKKQIIEDLNSSEILNILIDNKAPVN